MKVRIARICSPARRRRARRPPRPCRSASPYRERPGALRAVRQPRPRSRRSQPRPATSTTMCSRCPGARPTAPTAKATATSRSATSPRPALCLRSARLVAAARARLAGELPQRRPRLGARARRASACSTSCPASGWSSTSTASTARVRASAWTAISIWHGASTTRCRFRTRFVRLTDDRLLVSPGELIDDFLAANPELKPDMIAVQCGGSGNRLREVRICFDKSGNFRACGPNENQRRLCSAEPHVRSPGACRRLRRERSRTGRPDHRGRSCRSPSRCRQPVADATLLRPN